MTRHRLALVGFALGMLLIPIVPFAVIGELPGEQWLKSTGSASTAFAATGAALLGLDVLLPIPSSVIGVLLGARVGVVLGTLAAWLGLTAGHCIGYGLGRLAPKRWCPEVRVTPSLFLVLATRPVPILAEALTFAAGALQVPFRSFVLCVGLGNLAYAGTLAAVGAAVVPEGQLWTTLLVLLVLFTCPWLAFRWWYARHKTPGDSPIPPASRQAHATGPNPPRQ